jgi:UV DNA damage endonuclease
MHPDHFVKIGSPRPDVCATGLAELERHSRMFDLMGYEPSPENKLNIHVGGVYGDKLATLERFKASVRKMSPNLRKRLTVENDDVPNSYSVDDLYPMAVEMGLPIVFDLHHIRFCKGAWTDREALDAALSTWPEGVRPVVHWSESQAGRKPLAHSDYVQGPLDLYGVDPNSVDIMIEAKAKEKALMQAVGRC